MNDDILKSVPQGGGREEDSEIKRIHEVADELRRGCQLYEAQLRDSKEYVSQLEIEHPSYRRKITR